MQQLELPASQPRPTLMRRFQQSLYQPVRAELEAARKSFLFFSSTVVASLVTATGNVTNLKNSIHLSFKEEKSC